MAAQAQQVEWRVLRGLQAGPLAVAAGSAFRMPSGLAGPSLSVAPLTALIGLLSPIVAPLRASDSDCSSFAGKASADLGSAGAGFAGAAACS